MRVKNSLGVYQHNKGTKSLNYDDSPYVLDKTRTFYLFDVIPVPAPRMTQSDRWKTNPNHVDERKRQRKSVAAYFAYKDLLKLQANLMKYEIKPVLEVLFLMPMPDSWSAKKKESMNGKPCQVKPDTDNLMKAIKDTFCVNDSFIWRETGEKRWAYKGSVIIFE